MARKKKEEVITEALDKAIEKIDTGRDALVTEAGKALAEEAKKSAGSNAITDIIDEETSKKSTKSDNFMNRLVKRVLKLFGK